MLKLTSKTAKILYSIVVSIIIAFIWNNAWKITSILGIPPGSLLNKVVRDLIVIIPVLMLTAFVIKPKEIFPFLGLNGNIIKGLGIAFSV